MTARDQSPPVKFSSLAQILKEKLRNQPRVLIAVSGGADSVALLWAAQELRSAGEVDFEVAHFQHHLRGEDSLADQKFVVELCEKLKIPCHVGEADWSQEKPSEATARQQRYAFFVQTCLDRGLTTVMTGHHAADQVETVLHHLIRGTSLTGLAGMAEERPLEHGIILSRPFLNMTRSAIESYLAEIEQEYCVDQTNAQSDFTRNRIRNELLPLLKQSFNEQVEAALLRLSQRAREVDDYLRGIAATVLRDATLELSPLLCRLNAKTLLKHPELIRREAFVLLWESQGWPRQKMGAQEWQKLSNVVEITTTSFDLPGPIHVDRRSGMVVLTNRPHKAKNGNEEAIKYQ